MSTILFKTDLLKEAMSTLSSATTNRGISEMNGNIIMSVKSNFILFRAADESIQILYRLKSDAYTYDGLEFDLVFPGRKMHDVISRMTGDRITMRINQQRATLSSRTTKVDLNCIPADLYPDIPSMKDASSFQISSDLLYYMYKKTSYAVSKSDSTPILTGLNHQIEGNDFCIVGCDRARLAVQYVDLDTKFESKSVVVPFRAVEEVRSKAKQNQTIKVSFTETTICYEMNDVKIYSKLLEGQYPNLISKIPAPEAAKCVFEANVNELRASLSRCSLFYEKDTQIGFCVVNPSLNRLRVMSQETSIGEMKDDLLVSSGKGENVVFCFAIRSFQDILSNTNSDSVEIRVIENKDNKSMILVKPKNDLSKNIDVFMPIVTSRKIDLEITDFQMNDEDPTSNLRQAAAVV